MLARTGGFAVLSATGGLLAACGGGKGGQTAPGAQTGSGGQAAGGAAGGRFQNLTVGVASPPSGLDPARGTSSEIGAFQQMYEGLVARLPDRSIVPALAAGPMEQVADDTWRVELRDDRTFTDGTPITVEDVKFSWDRVLSEKFGSSYRDYLGFVRGVRIVGKNELEFKTKGPISIMERRAAIVRIVPRKVVEAKGDKEFARNPGVTSGSMFNSEPLSPKGVKMQAYEGYEGVFPVYTDTAGYEYIPETATRLANLRGGSIQVAVRMDPTLYDAIRSDPNLELGISDVKGSTLVCLAMFNCGKRPFSDQRVRQAVMYGMDREQLIKIVDQGQGALADSPLPTSEDNYVQPSVVYHYDPEKAKSLLREAGYRDGLDFELNVTDSTPTRGYAPLLQQSLKAAGINVKLRVRNIDGAFPEIFAGKYDAWVFPTQFEGFSYDPDMLIRGWWGGTYNEKAAFWTTPGAKRVPKLLDQALTESSADKRRELYGEAQQIIMEEAASCPMTFQATAIAYSKKLQGFTPPSVGNLTSIYKVRPA